MISFSKTLLGFAALMLSQAFSQTQAQQYDQQSGDRPTLSAARLDTEPVIDGDIRNEALWQTVTPIEKLIQIRPQFGKPATEKTEIRVGYTQKMFYVAVVCYDSDRDPSLFQIQDAMPT